MKNESDENNAKTKRRKNMSHKRNSTSKSIK